MHNAQAKGDDEHHAMAITALFVKRSSETPHSVETRLAAAS